MFPVNYQYLIAIFIYALFSLDDYSVGPINSCLYFFLVSMAFFFIKWQTSKKYLNPFLTRGLLHTPKVFSAFFKCFTLSLLSGHCFPILSSHCSKKKTKQTNKQLPSTLPGGKGSSSKMGKEGQPTLYYKQKFGFYSFFILNLISICSTIHSRKRLPQIRWKLNVPRNFMIKTKIFAIFFCFYLFDVYNSIVNHGNCWSLFWLIWIEGTYT